MSLPMEQVSQGGVQLGIYSPRHIASSWKKLTGMHAMSSVLWDQKVMLFLRSITEAWLELTVPYECT